MRMILFLLAILSIAGCKPDCYYNAFDDIRPYEFSPDVVTPSGIEVDTSGFPVDLQEIDNQFARAEECLGQLVDRNYTPVSSADCWGPIRKLPLKRHCLALKIVKPKLSQCSEWHFLDRLAPQGLCDNKGLEPNPDCPCRWRWATQRDVIIVSPPGHLGKPYLYDVVRIHSGCNNYWADPELSYCASLTERENTNYLGELADES